MDFALKRHVVEARDLPDLWFQAIHDIFEHGRRFVIDCGSYAGQTRLEYDYFTGHVAHPGAQPLIPEIPPTIDVPAPVEAAYIYGGEGYDRAYIEYLMSARKEEGESYTYGERLIKVDMMYYWLNLLHYKSFDYMNDIYYGSDLSSLEAIEANDAYNDDIMYRDPDQVGYDFLTVEKDVPAYFLNQVAYIIHTYKKKGHRNNQLVLQVAQPSDILLKDPPCLRSIDTRIQDNKLHFFVYFRSWDLWGGLPANLAGIQNLKEYMAAEIGVEDGEMIVESKGLHLYGYAEELGKIRCMMED
jgi:thymidylate synthase